MKLPHPGEILEGKYRLEEMLGEGAFGLVVKATTISTSRPVAVKLLKPSPGGYKDSRTQRFMRELRVIARLQCPNTLTLFDYGRTDEGVLYMVTEYVEGEDLYDLLNRRGQLSEKEVIHVLHQTLLSLSEAHEHGVLHRDIKPHNIRLAQYQGDPLRVKVLDFGLSKTLEDADSQTLTAAGIAVGTPRYMSPEQLNGKELTPATDIYSLGLVAYEMVTGEPATPLDDVVGPRRQVRLETNAPVSVGLRLLINRMVAKPLIERYSTASDVLADLKAVRAGASPADRSSDLRSRSGRFEAADTEEDHPVGGRSRHTGERRRLEIDETRPPSRAPIVIAGIVVAVGLASGAAWWFGGEREERVVPPGRSGVELTRIAQVAEADTAQTAVGVDTAPGDKTPAVAAPDGCQGLQRLEPGVQTLSRLLGITREEALVRVPEGYEPTKRYGLIWIFHDYTNSAEDMLRALDYESVEDLEPFIVLASQGDELMAWSTSAEFETALGNLDVAREMLCVDPDRFFVWGHGFGGRIAVRRAMCMDAVAAVATSSYRERLSHTLCEPETSVPYLHIGSNNDLIAPVDGGGGCFAHLLPAPAPSFTAHETFFKQRYGCDGSPRPRPSVDHGECHTWRCETPFVSCRVDGGRMLPGLTTKHRCATQSVPFPYTRQVWEFFSQFSNSRDDATP